MLEGKTTAQRKKELAALASSVNSRIGKKVMTTADECSDVGGLKRPSGIAQLDIDCGGGAPAGSVIKINGPDQSGKSSLVFSYVAMQQRIYGEDCAVLYCPTENKPDFNLMDRCRCRVAWPRQNILAEEKRRKSFDLPTLTKEELKVLNTTVGVFHIMTCDSGEELLEEVLFALKKNIYNLIIIDSLTVVQPNEELEKDMDDNMKKATHASLITRWTNKVHPYLSNVCAEDPTWTTLIITEQMRANQEKSMYNPNPFQRSESMSQRHGSVLSLELQGNTTKIKSTRGANKGEVIGKELKWKTAKGTRGTHDNISNAFDLMYDQPWHFDWEKSVLIAGTKYGLISERNGKIEVLDSSDKVLLQGLTADELCIRLRNEPDLDEKIRMHLLRKALPGVSCRYR